jgi:2-deoxy-D-gluconate 3-dehydrogenase
VKTAALFDLTGRVAIVTGGNGGIGRGIALGLAEAGAAVAIFGRNEEKNRNVLAELKAAGVPSMAVKVDLTDRAALEPACNQVERQLGPVSVLVNNAGNVSVSGGVLNEKPEDWDNVLETQLNAVFLLSKLAAQSMLRRQQGGKIINIGSMYSFFGSGLIPSYSAAKGAIVQLTKSMAIELAPAQHTSQCDRARVDRNRHDRTRPRHTLERRNPCAHAGWSMGAGGGNCRHRCLSGFARLGLCDRRNHPCRWRLCHPIIDVK